MSKRLATEYVKACLILSEAELRQFLALFAEHHIELQVKVFENGSQEIVFQQDAGEEIILTFERVGSDFVLNGSCRFNNPKLANVLRKAISVFKGDAVVNRFYPRYTMVYTYRNGAVTQIVEVNDQREKLIYEYKDTLGELERLFSKKDIEMEIQHIQARINELLDERNQITDASHHQNVDAQLMQLTHKLFFLEA